jgi:uncharacterized membrane protein
VGTAEEWALFFHLVGAFVLVSGVTIAGAAFGLARRRRLAGEVVVLLEMARVGALLASLGALVVLPFGLWLVHLGGFGYGSGWIVAALVLFVLVLILGALGGQAPKRARRLAEQLPRDGEVTPEVRGLLADRRALALNLLATVLLVAIVVLMVFRPG